MTDSASSTLHQLADKANVFLEECLTSACLLTSAEEINTAVIDCSKCVNSMRNAVETDESLKEGEYLQALNERLDNVNSVTDILRKIARQKEEQALSGCPYCRSRYESLFQRPVMDNDSWIRHELATCPLYNFDRMIAAERDANKDLMRQTPCATIKLSNGVEMPAVGLRSWLSAPGEAKAAVKAAVKAGYRLIDTASVYKNEDDVGAAIQELIDEGVVKREELFVTTKAWAHELIPGQTVPALRESLKRLRLDYVDLYLAHVPTAFNADMSVALNEITVEGIWEGFDEAYRLGLAKAVGVSNWSDQQIERVLNLKLTPVHNSQVELHLYFPQKAHAAFCKKHGIVITSYCTLGSPDEESLNWQPDAPSDLKDPLVAALADKYKKTPAQVLLRYALDRGFAIIPKSVNADTIKENFQLFDFKLTDDDINLLETSNQNKRLFLHEFMIGHIEDSLLSVRYSAGYP